MLRAETLEIAKYGQHNGFVETYLRDFCNECLRLRNSY